MTRMLLENEIHGQVNSTSYFALMVDAPKLIERVLTFVRQSIQWNGFVSGLNTNFGISLNSRVDESPVINSVGSIVMNPSNVSYACTDTVCSLSPAGFYELNTTIDPWSNWRLFVDRNQFNTSDYAWGFAASTTILEGLLESRLDCLHEWTCLHMLQRYFPLLTQVCQNGEDNLKGKHKLLLIGESNGTFLGTHKSNSCSTSFSFVHQPNSNENKLRTFL